MKIEVLLITVLLIAGFAGLIAAEVNQSDNSTMPSVNKTVNWISRCAAIDHRIEGKLAAYNDNRDPHFARFSKLSNVIDRVINNSYEKGYNTTALEADLSILNEKIIKFQDDYDLFIQKLANTRNFTCGHSEGQFQAALNESKAQLKIVRNDAEDIKNFFDTTIKSDIKDLKEQRKDAAEARRAERLQNRKLMIEEKGNKVREGMNRVNNWSRNPRGDMNRTRGRN